jgi:anti-sigma regulatory factor (Ser/Thr protein kinase)
MRETNACEQKEITLDDAHSISAASGGNGKSGIASRLATEETMENNTWRILDEWTVASEPGNERLVMEQVGMAVKKLNISTRRLAGLKTAVAEAVMNAMEHGNHYEASKPVAIQVLASQDSVSVRITDKGGSQPIPTNPQTPDLEAKLAELQTPRGWGLFLIKNLVDEMQVVSDTVHHTVELIVYLEGESHASKKS